MCTRAGCSSHWDPKFTFCELRRRCGRQRGIVPEICINRNVCVQTRRNVSSQAVTAVTVLHFTPLNSHKQQHFTVNIHTGCLMSLSTVLKIWSRVVSGRLLCWSVLICSVPGDMLSRYQLLNHIWMQMTWRRDQTVWCQWRGCCLLGSDWRSGVMFLLYSWPPDNHWPGKTASKQLYRVL